MGLLNIFDYFKNKEMVAVSYDFEETDAYRKLATESAHNLIAKTFSRAEFQTYENGIQEKGKSYYLFNVEPNPNTSASVFWRDVIKKLLTEDEALILLKDQSLYLADSFDRESEGTKENQYKNIVINGALERAVVRESKVLYLTDPYSVINRSTKGLYQHYHSLIHASSSGYANSKSRKGTITIPTRLSQQYGDAKELQEYIKSLLKDFMDPEKNSVLPLTNGMEYEEIKADLSSSSNDSGRELKNFAFDIFDFVAISLGVPPSLLKGDTVDTKDAVSNFLTFCINPLGNLVADEINRKMYGLRDYTKNNKLRFDSSNIRAISLRDVANSIELLNRNGALTIDDTLRILDKEPIGGEVGKMRFITKNLQILDEKIGKEE